MTKVNLFSFKKFYRQVLSTVNIEVDIYKQLDINLDEND